MVLDPRAYKGTNYTPCIGTNFVANLGLLPMIPDPNTRRPAVGGGFFDEVHCRTEIAELAAHGLNSIRIVGSFYGWLCYPDYYVHCLRRLSRICNSNGVSITYCLWNTTAWGWATDEGYGNWPFGLLSFQNFDHPPNQALLNLMFWLGDNWLGNLRARPDANITQFSEPCPGTLWDAGMADWGPNLIQRMEEYLIDICRFFHKDPDGVLAIGSIDLHNEPDVIWAPPYSHRLNAALEFIKWTYERVRDNAPGALCTIGWADVALAHQGGILDHNELVRRMGVDQDYYSFHSYEQPALFRNVGPSVSRYFPQRLPVVCSEFWKAEFRGNLGAILSELTGFGFGGQMWGFLQHNAYYYDSVFDIITGEVDGVRIPDPYTTIQAGTAFSFMDANERDTHSVVNW